jgi:hypothetical protein
MLVAHGPSPASARAMNVLAHTWVARACGLAAPEEVLGAVAPDLATMAGVRLDRAALRGPVADGVRCHLRTDAAFHHDATFLAGSSALRKDLLAVGVPRGAARAVGHVGWELLLDGLLVRTPAEDAFRRALGLADSVIGAVRPEDRPRWQAFLAHRRPAPALRYDDPEWVADRLVGMLAGSTRLRLPADDAPAVAAVLAIHVESVADAGEGVLAATADAVRH